MRAEGTLKIQSTGAHICCGLCEGLECARSTPEGRVFARGGPGPCADTPTVRRLVPPTLRDPSQESFWRAHEQRVASIDFVESARLLETFVVTASTSGDVALWTLAGSLVGVFGQEDHWDLTNPDTFCGRAPASALLAEEHAISERERACERGDGGMTARKPVWCVWKVFGQ